MRRTVRLFAAVGPAERLGRAIAAMPAAVQRTLAEVACRTDMRLASGSWQDDGGGCLVANVVACVGDPNDLRTLDLRMLDAFPQMSSRDLNTLIVAWDEAAAQAEVVDDQGLRTLLHQGLAWAGVAVPARSGLSPSDGDGMSPPAQPRPLVGVSDGEVK